MEELHVSDLEQILDKVALQQGMIDENEVFEAVADSMDGPDEEFGPVMRKTLRHLLEIRVSDEKAFDVLCLKLLCPGMTQSDLAAAMTAMGKAKWNHRARCCERVKSLVKRYPQLDGVLVFDRRGGANRRRVTGERLLEEYEELKAREKRKAPHKRRPCKGEGGLLEVLAKRHRIKGIFGKPSWQAAYQRINRAKAAADG